MFPRFIFKEHPVMLLNRPATREEMLAGIILIEGHFFILQGTVPTDMYWQEVEMTTIDPKELTTA